MGVLGFSASGAHKGSGFSASGVYKGLGLSVSGVTTCGQKAPEGILKTCWRPLP